jgi:signal transduction histidine kinase
VAIAPALHECIRLVADAAERKRLAINVSCEPPDLTMRLDPRAFGQVFINLLSNAVKFTETGRVDLSVRQDGASLAIAVKDTGIGIEAELLPNLFEPFRQAHARISHRYGGTGLGLSICRNLVELQGGTIGIESTPAVGTTVTVRFPIARIIPATPPSGF